jgi:hypothetical protein
MSEASLQSATLRSSLFLLTATQVTRLLGRVRHKPGAQEPEQPEPHPVSDPTSVRDIQLRKLVYNGHAVEKVLIKGSVKLMGNTATIPLKQLLA